MVSSGYVAERPVVAVSSGYAASLVVCGDGRVATFGYNGEGELDDSTNAQWTEPVLVVDTGALADQKVIAASMAWQHALALTDTGALVAWGANDGGQLGNNSFTDSNVPVVVATTNLPAGGGRPPAPRRA